MVGRAVSEQVKKVKARRKLNSIHQEAVNEYLREQLKPEKARRGLRPIAAKHGINHKTLSNLANGKQSMSAFNASKKKLSDEEERVLVDLVLESADRGLPLTRSALRATANAIIKGCDGESYTPVGIGWVSRFLDRHHDEIQVHWSKPLDTQRARALNPEVVRKWFELVKESVVLAGIKPEDIYGMDESGFPPSDQGTQHVLGSRGTKTQHKQGSANRENVTVLVTVCADGTTVKPCVVFKGKKFQKAWCQDNISEAA
jgi:hypothetical protein